MKVLSPAALALCAALAFAAPADAQDAAKPAPAPAAAPPAAKHETKHEAKPAGKPEGTKPAHPAKADAGKTDAAKPHEAKSAPAAAGPAQPHVPDRAEAITRANAFFNASPVMVADFVQIGGDGKRSEGKLHVQRAGRVRFEYAAPATMEVVSDGAQVLVRDRKLNTYDLYFIDQTPLKFLLKEKIDLEHDVKVLDVTTDDSGTIISIEDKATFGGTSHLKLTFDTKTFKLKQWQVTDPQGYETLISLFNVDQKQTPDPALFKIDVARKTGQN